MSQPIGPLVSQQGPAARPPGSTLHGRHITLTPLQPSHAPSSFAHLAGPENADRWTYMLSGPYPTLPEWQSAITSWSGVEKDPLFYAALLKNEKGEEEAVGLLSYMNVVPDHRRVEIGSINLGAVLQRTRASTEAFYLFIRHAFEELGYVRVEWKANHLNAPSLAAAERLGFVFEGIFRRHMILKGRSRDTAWYSITEEEWPRVKRAVEVWLRDENFDGEGRQIKGLKEVRESLEGGS